MLFIKSKRNKFNFSKSKDSPLEEKIKGLDYNAETEIAQNRANEYPEMAEGAKEQIEQARKANEDFIAYKEAEARKFMSSKAQQDAIIANGDIPQTRTGDVYKPEFMPVLRENVGVRPRIHPRPEPEWTSGKVPLAHQLPIEYQKGEDLNPSYANKKTEEFLKKLILKDKLLESSSVADHYKYLIKNTLPKQK